MDLNVSSLLRPHAKSLVIGLLAVAVGSAAALLEPWPLKIVFDHVSKTHGRLERLMPASIGPHALLEVVAIAVVIIAAVEAICSYIEKYATTSVGQWITHDLRRLLYAHIQRLSLSYHTQKQTGDLISRLTSDIDAVQSFIVSSLLDLTIDALTLAGIAAMMLYLNWRFTLVALSIAPVLFGVSYFYTRRSKKASRVLRRKEGEIVSLVQEVLSAIGVVKAFAQEDHEQQRLEEKSLQSVQVALRARSLKAKLSPLVEVVTAVGTALVLWYGGRLVLAGELSAGSLVVFIWYLGKMYKPMRDFAKMTDAYAKAVVGYERLLWENIAYGKPEATAVEIRHAAELANAHAFISQLPDGYDTIVGERGVALSGGQRQRIAIARAMIRDTPILIMDEPSSGLDAASEELVFEAIERLIEGKTAIVIAHRFSTIRRADAILVVQDGRIVEHGKHDHLLAANGLYAKLYELQFRRGDAIPDLAVSGTTS